jgi:Uma2 family endonuclease
MATTTQLTADQYLKMHFEELEPEFVHGELVERPMPTSLHGRLHYLLALRLQNAGFGMIGVRMRLADDVIRIPDLAFFREPTEERIPTSPPLIVVEIISPDDRYYEPMKKLDEYRTWGVENIWIVEPDLKKFHVYDSGGLIEAKQFELPGAGIRIPADELFAEATAR